MSLDKSLSALGENAKKQAAKSKGGKHSVLWGIAQALNGAIHGLAAQLGGTFSAMAKVMDIYGNLARGLDDTIADTLRRVVIYLIQGRLRAIWRAIHHDYAILSANIKHDYRMALNHVQYYYQKARAYTRQEAGYLLQNIQIALAQAKAYTRSQVKVLHRTIEQEAVSGYRTGYQGRTSEIAKVADFLANYNPLVRSLVSDLVTGVLDLATIEDPLARFLLGAILKHIIDRLSVDKAVGVFLQDLLAPILGQPKPIGLHDVITDVSLRLAAGEAQWSQFYQDGGTQVEQAGSGWQEIIGPVADVGILAFMTQAWLDPHDWAREISDTIGVVANDTASKFIQLIGEA